MKNNQNLPNRQINSNNVNGRQLTSTSPFHNNYRGRTPNKYNTNHNNRPYSNGRRSKSNNWSISNNRSYSDNRSYSNRRTQNRCNNNNDINNRTGHKVTIDITIITSQTIETAIIVTSDCITITSLIKTQKKQFAE